MDKFFLNLSFIFFSSFLFTVGYADTPIGKVVMAVGKVTAKTGNGPEHKLDRHSDVYKEDVIVTGANSQTQIRFTDDTMVSIIPNSNYKITKYRYTSPAAKNNEYESNFISGGFRIVIGAIGHTNPKDFHLVSPVATIGIRNTQIFTVLACNAAGRQASGACTSNTQFIEVEHGTIEVSNKEGSITVGEDAPYSYAIVKPESAPEGTLDKPAEITAGQMGEVGTTTTASSSNSTDSSSSTEESNAAPMGGASSDSGSAVNDTTTQQVINNAGDGGDDQPVVFDRLGFYAQPSASFNLNFVFANSNTFGRPVLQKNIFNTFDPDVVVESVARKESGVASGLGSTTVDTDNAPVNWGVWNQFTLFPDVDTTTGGTVSVGKTPWITAIASPVDIRTVAPVTYGFSFTLSVRGVGDTNGTSTTIGTSGNPINISIGFPNPNIHGGMSLTDNLGKTWSVTLIGGLPVNTSGLRFSGTSVFGTYDGNSVNFGGTVGGTLVGANAQGIAGGFVLHGRDSDGDPAHTAGTFVLLRTP